MNVIKRTIITLSEEELDILKEASRILFDLADVVTENGGNSGGYDIRGMSTDLENFVEDNAEIVCGEE